MEKISRKTFLKILLGLLAAFLGYLTLGIFNIQRNMGSRNKQVELNANLPEGLSFFNNIIVNKNNGKITIFYSKCPHLGCIIDKATNNELICPCHGSRFSSDGKVINGPANKDLTKLEYKIVNNKIIVNTGEDV